MHGHPLLLVIISALLWTTETAMNGGCRSKLFQAGKALEVTSYNDEGERIERDDSEIHTIGSIMVNHVPRALARRSCAVLGVGHGEIGVSRKGRVVGWAVCRGGENAAALRDGWADL